MDKTERNNRPEVLTADKAEATEAIGQKKPDENGQAIPRDTVVPDKPLPRGTSVPSEPTPGAEAVDAREMKPLREPSAPTSEVPGISHALEALSDEQLDAMLDRLIRIKQKKAAAEVAASLSTAESGENPASERPKKARTGPVILPDPTCFEDMTDPSVLAEEETTLPSQSETEAASTEAAVVISVPGEEAAPPGNTPTADGTEELDEETLAMYRDLVRRRKKQRRTVTVLLSVLGVLLLLLLLLLGYLKYYTPDIDDGKLPFDPTVTGTADPNDTEKIPDDTAPTTEDGKGQGDPDDDFTPTVSDTYARRENVYNFLVLGIDRAANLSDVIMIVSYDVENGNAHVLQVPRDTYINVNGAKYHKLNAYFAASYNRSHKRGEARYRDAIASMVDFLEAGLCIKLDRYVCMDTAGFREIVDAIGGVTMDVPFDMDYEDPEQDLYIHLKAGYQHLDGEKAEQFVRFRKAYLNGDLGRISAQKLFLTALVKQIQSSLDIPTAVTLAKTVLTYLSTDLTAAEAGYFAKSALSLDLEKITYTTLPGGGAVNPTSGASYYVMYAENVRNLVNTYFNVYTREISKDVFLGNSTHFTSTEAYIAEVFLSSIMQNDTESAKDVDPSGADIPVRGK